MWRRLNNSRYLHFADQVHLLNFVYVLIQNENSSMCLTFDNDIHQTEKQQSGGLWTVAAHFKMFFFFLPSNFIDSVPRAQRRIQSISKHNDTFQILSIYCCKDKAGFQHQPQCMALSLCNLWAFADTSSKGLTSHRSFRLHGPPGLSVEFFQKFDNRKADLILKFPEMKQP